MDKLSVGRFIAEQRKARQMTQKQLAEKLNVTDKAVSKWETGKCYPDVEMLEKLSSFFGVTVNDTLSGKILSESNMVEETDKNIIRIMKDTKKEKRKSGLLLIVIGVILSAVLFYFLFCILRLTFVLPQIFSDSAEVNGLQITYNQLLDTACAEACLVPENTDSFEITVPDEYNGVPVEKLGRISGSAPFLIDLSDLYMNAYEGSKYYAVYTAEAITSDAFAESFSIQNVVFKLNIGKNIKEINYVKMDEYYPHINEDGSIVFYHPVVEIYCSEDNGHFYSKNGKLYDKKTDKLITDFSYSYIEK